MAAAIALLGLTAMVPPAWAQGTQHIDRATLSSAGAASTASVRLPDSWNRSGRSGTWTYALAFSLVEKPIDPWSAYVPRIGNRAAVSLNGRVIERFGRLEDDIADYSNRPQLITLPADALVPGRNVLTFVVQGEKARYAGLSDVTLGPSAALSTRFLLREALQLWGSFAVILVSALFALIAGIVAVRTRDRSFALFTGACLFCALRTSYAIFVEPPMDYRLWAAVLDACYAGYLACLCLFCVGALDMRYRWIPAATAALVASTAVLLPVYAWLRVATARDVILALMLVYALALCVAFVHHWRRTRTEASRYIALAGIVSCALAVHDHLVILHGADGYSKVALARYSLMLFVLAMGALLVDRYARQIQTEMALRVEVRDELESKRHELEAHFDRQQVLASRNAQQLERERLMQDLHDGMGLQLTGLLGIVQDKPLERAELTLEVRTAIEQMRMLLDNTAPFDGDLSILMGHIRYRIEHRLAQRGIALEWKVVLQTPERPVATEHAIALQRLVFEWVTNTLRHSGATVVSFSAQDASPSCPGLHLVYQDNGRGFTKSATAGFGTKTIRRRVADLGGQLDVTSSAGAGVRYDIRIADALVARVDPDALPSSG